MSNSEDRMTRLLDFPYGSYLMVRFEYACLCTDELEAKIMRIIEMYMDNERRKLLQDYLNDPKLKMSKDQTIDITKDVWVSISYRLFTYDLYEMVKSDNTLKRAIKSLQDKNFICVKFEQASRYDAPKYQINVDVVQSELNKLKQQGKAGYQKLTPSKIDTLKVSAPQNLIPSEGQNLIPSENSLSTKSEMRVSNFDTNSRSKSNNIREEKTTTDVDTSQQLEFSSQEEDKSSRTKPAKEKRIAPAKTPQLEEPDLSSLSELEQKIYATLRKQDKEIYLKWTQPKRNVYNNWLGMFGYAAPVDITNAVVSTVDRFEPIQPTTEDFLGIRKHATDQEKNKPTDKRYYKQRGFKIWDAAREYAGWKSQKDMDGQSEDAPKKNQQMSREDLMAKALDFPTGMDHTTIQYQELQNCLMYLQPDDRAEVTRQRIQKQIAKQKKQVSA